MSRAARRRRTALLFWLLPALSLAAPAAAQWNGPLLPRDHWVRPVLLRLETLGHLPAAYDASGDGWTRGGAAAALDAALETLRREPVEPSAAALVRGARARLLRESGALADPAARLRFAASATLGGALVEGGVAAGFDRPDGAPSEPPVPLAPDREGRLSARVALAPTRWLAAEVEPAVVDGGAVSLGGHVAIRAGPLVGWGGRRRVGGGPGQARVVLTTTAPVDGGGLALARGIVAPGPLRWLGPIHAELLVTRTDAAGSTGRPWLLGMRGSLRPHPRVRLGVERAALVGGGGREVAFGELLRTIVGAQGDATAIDNQILALDLRLTPRLGTVPLVVYGLLGMDDAAGAWLDVPAHVLRIGVPAVPGAPRLALGVGRTEFSRSCCGNPAWYRHTALPWLQGRSLLGHPLGGHGREWRATGRYDAPGADLALAAEAFHRWRGEENALSPVRAGASRGGGLRVAFRRSRVELEGGVLVEAGAGWNAHVLRAGLTVRY